MRQTAPAGLSLPPLLKSSLGLKEPPFTKKYGYLNRQTPLLLKGGAAGLSLPGRFASFIIMAVKNLNDGFYQ